jgi:heterodisulfide reductase subunit D
MSRLDLSRFSFRQLLELDACTRCGECVAWCPVYTPTGRETITPRGKIQAFRDFVQRQHGPRSILGPRPIASDALAGLSNENYSCTLCGRCNTVCPVKINTRALWVSLRAAMVAQGHYPAVMATLRDTVAARYNISGDPNEARLGWADNLEQPIAGLAQRPRAKVVYFTGCVAAFYPLAYGIPQSFAQILDKVGLDFTCLGGQEWCCGFPLLNAGMSDAVEALVQHNIAAVQAIGARVLVTTCPSCYHTWQHTYRQVYGQPLGFDVLHASELLAALLAAKRLPLQPLEETITYHDPCDLGRQSGLYDEPRRVLQSIPGLELVEMTETRERALCCGGGGDVEMANADLVAAVAQRRLQMALDTGARTVVSACQQCKRTLVSAARREKAKVKVLDIAEVVWQAMAGSTDQ